MRRKCSDPVLYECVLLVQQKRFVHSLWRLSEKNNDSLPECRILVKAFYPYSRWYHSNHRKSKRNIHQRIMSRTFCFLVRIFFLSFPDAWFQWKCRNIGLWICNAFHHRIHFPQHMNFCSRQNKGCEPDRFHFLSRVYQEWGFRWVWHGSTPIGRQYICITIHFDTDS